MELRKIYAIAIALSKSQLRTQTSGRAGASIFRRPSIILILDVAVFVVTALLGYLAAIALVQTYPQGAASAGGQYYTELVKVVEEALVFIPTFVPSSVLLGGLLFEMSVSSKFSASDTVNWLPVTQVEYVAASAVSVAYNYSVVPALFLGITLMPAFTLGYGWLWFGALLFSLLGLFTGGILVEIIRAAINRVSSLVGGHARRGAFVLRLIFFVVILVVVDTSFNPNVLIDVVNTLSSTLSFVPFIPILWGSVAIEAVATGDALRAALFSAATVVFTAVLVWVAVKVRAKYWSPTLAAVSISQAEYKPKAGILVRFGLTSSEAAIVRKDLKGVTRRRELISFFAVPIVFVAIFLIDSFAPGIGGNASGGGGSLIILTDLPVFLAGTIFALMISSISFGQESKGVMNLYSLPVTPDQILKAKAFVALLFTLTATVAIAVLFWFIGGNGPADLVENLVIAIAIDIEVVFIGLGFGASGPDFQERPRPRFVDPYKLLIMLPVGFVVAGVTVVPIVVRDVFSLASISGPTPLYLFPASLAFAVVVTVFAYRWARSNVRKLMSEYKV
jgi:hypothetical protein